MHVCNILYSVLLYSHKTGIPNTISYIYIYNVNIMELVGNVTINQNILYIIYDGLVIFPSKKTPKHSLRAALAAATTSKWYW